MNHDYDERVLVLSPQAEDARAVGTVVGSAGITVQACPDMDELCAGIRAGAGTAVISQQALNRASSEQLAATLNSQPAWSDLPLIVVAVGGGALRSNAVLQEALSLGNVAVLQRPLRAATVITTIRTALRARRRH